MNHTEDNKRLAKNTFALFVRTAVVLFVQLYVTRLVLKALGIEDFGIYNIVGSVVVLFSFINSAMSTASQRFITFEMGKGDRTQVNRVFSASMITQLVLALSMIFILEIVGYWMINFRLNIPEVRLGAANWAFQFSMLSFAFQIIRVPYDASVIAHEKMNFFALASIIDVFIKLVIAVVILKSNFDHLILYSLLLAADSLFLFVFYRFYCMKKFDICKFKFVNEKQLYEQMFSYTGWSLFGSGANVLTQQGFIFLINIFYGVTVNAAMGIANQVNAAVTSFVGSFTTSYRPQIVKSFAQGETDRTNKLISTTSKMSFALMIIPTLILIYNMPLVLNLWLGSVPKYAVEFCQMILICTILDATTSPYNAAIMAAGDIKKYQLSIGLVFLLDLLLSLVLMKMGIVPYLVLVSRILTRGFVNMIVGLIFIRKQLEFNVKKYLKDCIFPIFCIILFSVLFFRLFMNHFSGWSLLGVSSVCFVPITIFLEYFILFSNTERVYVKTMINRITNK